MIENQSTITISGSLEKWSDLVFSPNRLREAVQKKTRDFWGISEFKGGSFSIPKVLYIYQVIFGIPKHGKFWEKIGKNRKFGDFFFYLTASLCVMLASGVHWSLVLSHYYWSWFAVCNYSDTSCSCLSLKRRPCSKVCRLRKVNLIKLVIPVILVSLEKLVSQVKTRQPSKSIEKRV